MYLIYIAIHNMDIPTLIGINNIHSMYVQSVIEFMLETTMGG